MSIIEKRLNLIRTEMKLNQIDLYLVPSIDAHCSEYVPECWQRRFWISGFDGSAGEALISSKGAYLATDGRYILQAQKQLDTKHYTLVMPDGFSYGIEPWLKQNASGLIIGVDPRLISIARANSLAQVMSEINGSVKYIEHNLIDVCKQKLGEDLIIPKSPVYSLGLEYTGTSTAEKLSLLRDKLKSDNADYIALNVLDEIAWLFNFRGSDIEFNPLTICYALIGLKTGYLFIEPEKLSVDTADILTKIGIKIAPYQDFEKHLSSLSGNIILDSKFANYAMLQHAKEKATKIIFKESPLISLKGCKNPVEQEGARRAHLKDAVAVIRFLIWLENNWSHGIDEISAINELQKIRQTQDSFIGDSFNYIVGFAANGAIIHYKATIDSKMQIDDSNLLLIDSGGQFLEGTTDITRTIHLGEPTVEQKRHYTLVLKGHLAISRLIFPDGVCGEHIDAFARSFLWGDYLNYRHGTGHGVGSFLCVHEGPQKISPLTSNVKLLPGMIVSNEPGIYFTDNYGIRIENLCLIQRVNQLDADQSDYGPFYSFEDLTLVPYCKKLIDHELLTIEEKKQISAYYGSIRKKILPLLNERERLWLSNELELF